MLKQAVDDYLLWLMSKEYAHTTWIRYERVLKHFVSYVDKQKIPYEEVFTMGTEKAFREELGQKRLSTALRGLSHYLYRENRITRPIEQVRKELPEIYEQYLQYYKSSRQLGENKISKERNILAMLNDYLATKRIELKKIKIETMDSFLAERCRKLHPLTGQRERSRLRGFLRYLYQERKILRRDLADFVVSKPQFAQSTPPKFLRPHEMKELFAGIDKNTVKGLRTYAIVHLAYTLGLRPKEISLITLDDISFQRGEISLKDRKSVNPIRLPLPENTIKAITAYILGGRPEGPHREIFLMGRAPFSPVKPATICGDIAACMRKVNLSASAYWLRHTYAQNLLEQGASIFETKEMLGHDAIQTTKRYIHIDIKRMRETLLDETF